jgi:hypothetical protein
MSDAVAIIGAVATGIIGIIAAYGAYQSKKTHTLVNSNNDALLARQAVTDERVDQLEDELRNRGDGTVPKAPPEPKAPKA